MRFGAALVLITFLSGGAAPAVEDRIRIEVDYVKIYKRMEPNCADPYLEFIVDDGATVRSQTTPVKYNVCPKKKTHQNTAYRFHCIDFDPDGRYLISKVMDRDRGRDDKMLHTSKYLRYEVAPPGAKTHINSKDKAKLVADVSNPEPYVCIQFHGTFERRWGTSCSIFGGSACRTITLELQVPSGGAPTDVTIIEGVPLDFATSSFTFSVAPSTSLTTIDGPPDEPFGTQYEWTFTDVAPESTITIDYEIDPLADPYGRIFQSFVDVGTGLTPMSLKIEQIAYDGVAHDCNFNQVEDILEIKAGTLLDSDGDLDPDVCETSMPALSPVALALLTAALLLVGDRLSRWAPALQNTA